MSEFKNRYPIFPESSTNPNVRSVAQAVNTVSLALNAISAWHASLSIANPSAMITSIQESVPGILKLIHDGQGLVRSPVELTKSPKISPFLYRGEMVADRIEIQPEVLVNSMRLHIQELNAKNAQKQPEEDVQESEHETSPAHMAGTTCLYRGFLHQLKNTVSSMMNRAEIYADSGILNVDALKLTHAKIGSIEAEIQAALANPFPQTKFDLNEISYNIRQYLLHELSPYGIYVQYQNGKNTEGKNIIWSDTWSKIWADNIATNVAKKATHAGSLAVVVKPAVKIYKGQPFAEISVRDSGFPWSADIIKNGIQDGVSGFNEQGLEGTGFGLALDKEVLEKYNAQLVPTNYGKSGAVLTARFPIIE